MIDLLMLLAVATALRVFLPDIRTAVRRLLRAGARVGVAELLQTPSNRPATKAPAASRDTEE
ncbi:hypothetical protein AB0I84_12205 [Streptomyces spectabilis]|uniref:hypothetical protein n=1 Tax=Streptomyces spectabilis TaxID=68270 RepID=UPI00340B5B61